MPKDALATTFDDWESLLRAAEEHRNKKDLFVHLDKLQAARDRLRELESLRQSLQAQRQQATQEMAAVKEEGKLAAIEARSLLRGIVGHRNEGLVRFKVAPIRKLGPRKKATAKPDPAP